MTDIKHADLMVMAAETLAADLRALTNDNQSKQAHIDNLVVTIRALEDTAKRSQNNWEAEHLRVAELNAKVSELQQVAADLEQLLRIERAERDRQWEKRKGAEVALAIAKEQVKPKPKPKPDQVYIGQLMYRSVIGEFRSGPLVVECLGCRAIVLASQGKCLRCVEGCGHHDSALKTSEVVHLEQKAKVAE